MPGITGSDGSATISTLRRCDSCCGGFATGAQRWCPRRCWWCRRGCPPRPGLPGQSWMIENPRMTAAETTTCPGAKSCAEASPPMP